jgi:hypothetical protein
MSIASSSCRGNQSSGGGQGGYSRVGKCVSWEEQDGSLPGESTVSSSMLAKILSISSTAIGDTAIEEGSMDGKHLIMMCDLSFNHKKIPTHALIDCRVIGYSFIDQTFTMYHKLPLCPLTTPWVLKVIDGQKISLGDITHLIEVCIDVQGHCEKLPMFITKLGCYPIMLGIPWLKQHDVVIRFASNLVTFGSQHCLAHCID